MSTFQLVVTGLFVALVVVGIGVFAVFGGIGGKGSIGPVVVWGTVDQTAMDKVISSLGEQDKTLQDVHYEQHSAATYQTDLINAIAAGHGPDLVFMSQEDIGTLGDKTQLVPYSAMSQADFLSAYLDEGQLFLTPQGIIAFPFMIDPLVMYWNRDSFVAGGQAQAPQTWDDLLSVTPSLTKLAAGGGINASAVAMGTWDNVENAKAILSALMMQTGDFVTARDSTGALGITLGQKPQGQNEAPAAQALRFYTDFANPSKSVYSWNRSLQDSFTAFISGQTAVYFGFASEYRTIAERNPNLRFGVATLPQLKGSSSRITAGTVVGLAVARGARNPQGALAVAVKLTGAAASAAVAGQTGLPPARRDVQVDTSQSAAAATFIQSALMARSWADPNAAGSDVVFKSMIESVISGAADPNQAVFDAAQGLRQLLPKQ